MTFLVKTHLVKLTPTIQVVSIDNVAGRLNYTYRWMGDITGYDIANNLMIEKDHFGRIWKFRNPNFESQTSQSYKLMPFFDSSKGKFVTAVASDGNSESFVKDISVFWRSTQRAADIFKTKNLPILLNQVLSITREGYIKFFLNLNHKHIASLNNSQKKRLLK